MTNYSALSAPDILTTLYPRGVEEEFMVEFPAYGLFAKKLDYLAEGGRELNWQLDSGGGDATTVTEAEANEGPSTHVRPKITRVREYATATVEREDILATRNDKDRIIEVWDLAIGNCMRKLRRQWSMHMFRDGSGFRAQLAASSGHASVTLTLLNANDAKLFEIGDWVQGAYLNAGVPTLRSSGKLKVTARSIGAGTITAGSQWDSTITGLTDSDYLLRSGDLSNVVKGIAAWIPPTAPGASDSFFGINRYAMGEGAYGHRPSFSSSSLYEIGIDAMAYMHDVAGTAPDIWLVNSLDEASIAKDATSKERIVIPGEGIGKKKVEIGYEAIRIHGPNGKCDIVADPMCPRGKSWLLQREEVQWWTLGAIIDQITMGMGNENGFVKAGVDGVGIRFGGFGNFVITRPWHACYVALPTG